MRKEILILATVFSTNAFISCSKEQNELPGRAKQGNEEISSSINRGNVDPLTADLEGWFSFDNSLKDKSGKLTDGISSSRGVLYTTDRKGNPKSAIYLDSSYSVKIKSVPQQTHTSVSLWFKPLPFTNTIAGSILSSQAMGSNVHQPGIQMSGTVSTSVSTPGAYVPLIIPTWHHAVVTFDGSNVRIYLDNVLKATIPHPALIPASLSDYFVGKSFAWPLWKGYVDDLRFYSLTLSDINVSALYNL